MELRRYLFEKRMSVTEFAQKIQYSRSYISRVMHGNDKPTDKLAKAISECTDGQVDIYFKEDNLNAI